MNRPGPDYSNQSRILAIGQRLGSQRRISHARCTCWVPFRFLAAPRLAEAIEPGPIQGKPPIWETTMFWEGIPFCEGTLFWARSSLSEHACFECIGKEFCIDTLFCCRSMLWRGVLGKNSFWGKCIFWERFLYRCTVLPVSYTHLTLPTKA